MGNVCSPLCYNLIVQVEVREKAVRELQELEVNLCNVIHCDNTLVVGHEFCLSCFQELTCYNVSNILRGSSVLCLSCAGKEDRGDPGIHSLCMCKSSLGNLYTKHCRLQASLHWRN